MTRVLHRRPRAVRLWAALAAMLSLLASGCATEGTSSAVGFYGDTYWYDDPRYWNGCCVDIDRPDEIGPPRPEHPIAKPPPVRPSNPIASTPRPTPMPRAAARGGRR